MNIPISETNYILTNWKGPDIDEEILKAVVNCPLREHYIIFHPEAKTILKLLELKKEYYKLYIINRK